MEDLQGTEKLMRVHPKVIEQCGILGIPPEDMDKVYCDREFVNDHANLPYLISRLHSMDNWLR